MELKAYKTPVGPLVRFIGALCLIAVVLPISVAAKTVEKDSVQITLPAQGIGGDSAQKMQNGQSAEPAVACDGTAREGSACVAVARENVSDDGISRNGAMREDDGRLPVFGLFRDNYFITGIPITRAVSSATADVKFQLSIAFRLWRIKDKVDMLFTYTQRCFWNIYEESCPFRETAFNPGVWFSWQLRSDLRLMFGLEHESNGKGGEESRSWNYATAACLYAPYPHWRFGVRVWGGYYDRENNPSWFRYRGLGMAWATYHTLNDRFAVSVTVNPSNLFRNWNVSGEARWRITRKGEFAPSLFVQYEGGYARTMIDYREYANMVRVGVSLTSSRIGLY